MVLDILSIVFICVAINHLGLIEAIQKTIRFRLPIVNCCKCLTFWVSLIFLIKANSILSSLFWALLASYLSLWLELSMGILDSIYMIIYEKIFGKTDFNEAIGG